MLISELDMFLYYQAMFIMFLKRIFYSITIFFLLFFILFFCLIVDSFVWFIKPLDINQNTSDEFVVKFGDTTRDIIKSIRDTGIYIPEDKFLYISYIFRLDKIFRAGIYKISAFDSPVLLMRKLVNGDCIQNDNFRVVFIEGWKFNQFREELKNNPIIKQTIIDISDNDLMKMIGSDILCPEGLFYPDTYHVTPGLSDLDILKTSYKKNQMIITSLWENRQKDIPINTPYEALILASIIEKETGINDERGIISGVFINRLKLGMRLQSDPTVIYGMGDLFDSKEKNIDLKNDTPWNTYTRVGLPLTPISSVSMCSMIAALHPEKHNYIYFVSRGDGTTDFSEDLLSHNAKVYNFLIKRGLDFVR
ncbi:endolytic transglycosylase MltG [Candidatus Kinetoplastidibacterium galati]|uniref:Endolytic murein transglycosylase n=1 Tax=Candidatus Kinetoplastidibacterium galati TCC219 TaxID=1208921 RepID=M1MAY1_9PROT|nr:endolytic transglycosylase MltG [Candidatus Kinetoplastibacterium galatii]AGF49045.1 YceG-like aminodeoxychorismate lyase [Candidatus Kinetoplastibacterium galatii TCC219]